MCNFSERNVDDVIQQFDLESEQNLKAGKLSSGQKRRLTIAMVVITNPTLLILDEVTVGLDYELKMKVWSVILQLKNCAILAISHDMHEIDTLADQTCILDHGRIKVSDSLKNVKQMGNVAYNVQLFSVLLDQYPPNTIGRKNQDGSVVISFLRSWTIDSIFDYLIELKSCNSNLTWSIESV